MWRSSRNRNIACGLVVTVVVACGGSGMPAGVADEAARDVRLTVAVHTGRPGTPIDPRLRGTNVPAWLGPDVLGDPGFRATTRASGATTLRMPGGSWSNGYDWLACERADEDGCYWTWAARPTDFADFLRATGTAGIWTLSINHTAQSAAAAVAFFNGSVDDDRVIGVDRNGVDWATVGTWARLRAEHGNPDPVRIDLWEVGNEVYGGRPEAGGDQCAPFGWEDVWTCDGTEYVAGDDEYDGYLDIRAAIRAVDPAVQVGAVGVADPGSWSDWGREVIAAAGDDLDFYVVHHYGYERSPDPVDALQRPAAVWPGTVAAVRSALPAHVPVAVTEYNLVSFEGGDTERSMTRAVNALYIADTIGQLAVAGVAIANQWNLANGTTASGTDYGMIDLADGSTFPQFDALAAWASLGDTLLEVEIEGADNDDVRVYPTRRADDTLALLLLNLAGETTAVDIVLAGHGGPVDGVLTSAGTDDLDADDLRDDPPLTVSGPDGRLTGVELPAWSLNVMEIDLGG